jgi:hypothetical protein
VGTFRRFEAGAFIAEVGKLYEERASAASDL